MAPRDHRNHVPPGPRRREAHGVPGHQSPPPPGATSRSDEELRDDILQCLNQADFDASDLSVHIDNGTVSLRGQVEQAFKERVLDLINACGGLVTDDQVRWT